jgi:hypothetical protein
VLVSGGYMWWKYLLVILVVVDDHLVEFLEKIVHMLPKAVKSQNVAGPSPSMLV